MEPKYCIEITDGPSPDCRFAYFDSDDGLGQFLFEHEHVRLEVEQEYGEEGAPYRIVRCRVPREDREAFLRTVDLLPGLMAYVGRTDYEAFCRGILREASCGRGPARRAGT